jgi:hypothetical protein
MGVNWISGLNWINDLNKYCPPKDIQMANKHEKVMDISFR